MANRPVGKCSVDDWRWMSSSLSRTLSSHISLRDHSNAASAFSSPKTALVLSFGSTVWPPQMTGLYQYRSQLLAGYRRPDCVTLPDESLTVSFLAASA